MCSDERVSVKSLMKLSSVSLKLQNKMGRTVNDYLGCIFALWLCTVLLKKIGSRTVAVSEQGFCGASLVLDEM